MRAAQPFRQHPVVAAEEDDHVWPLLDAHVDVLPGHERHQQVHRDRPSGRCVPRACQLLAQQRGRQDPDRAEPSGSGDGRGQLATREPATEARLDDRDLELQQVERVHPGSIPGGRQRP